jgi:virginiamycin B lyase
MRFLVRTTLAILLPLSCALSAATAENASTFGEIQVPTPKSGLAAIALGDSRGCSLWFTERTADKVGCLSGGKITEYSLPAGSAPVGIAMNADRSAAVVESGRPGLTVVQPSGESAELDISPVVPGPPYYIAHGPGCANWFTVNNESSLAWYSLTRGTRYVGPTTNRDRAWKLAAVEGVPYLWIIDKEGQDVWRMDYKSAVQHVRSSSDAIPSVSPSMNSQNAFGASIAVAQDETVWFSYSSAIGPTIGRITASGKTTYFRIPTKGTQIADITWDGTQLWFTEYEANRIGRITGSGIVQEFSIPTQRAAPTSIVVDSSGLVWFAETGVNRLGWMRFPPARLRSSGY